MLYRYPGLSLPCEEVAARVSSGGFIKTTVVGSGIQRSTGGGGGPSITNRPARMEMCWFHIWTSMRTYLACTGFANSTVSGVFRTVLPTNNRPPSTYSKSVSASPTLDTSTLNTRTIWSVFLRDCMTTPETVCVAPASICIHSPTSLRAADQP